MSQEKTNPENKDLELINFYNPNSLFVRLTFGNLTHSLPLQNNWEKIRVHDYDPIISMDTRVKSGFVVAVDPAFNDRDARFVRFETRMDVRTSKREPDIRGLQSVFEKRGLDFDYVDKRFSDDPDNWGSYFITPKGAQIPVVLRLFDTQYSIYTMQLSVPATNVILKDGEQLASLQKDSFDVLKRVAGGIYDHEEKDFPSARLTFKAEEDNSPFYAVCSYCNQDYFADKSLTCPHCGGAKPVFITKKEET